MIDIANKGRTSFVVNHRILLVCLFSLSLVGTTYYYLDDRREPHEIQWVVASILWYITISFSIIKIFGKTRIGYIVAGIISWTTLAFWMLDNYYIIFHTTIIATKPDYTMTIRNFIGVGIASLGILSSHNAFHKVRHEAKSM